MSETYTLPPVLDLSQGTPTEIPLTGPMPVTASDRIRASVREASSRIIPTLPTAAQSFDFAVGRSSGSGSVLRPQIAQDLTDLTPTQLRIKYGDERASQLIDQSVTAQNQYDGQALSRRSAGEILGDTALTIANSVAQTGAAVAPVLGVMSPAVGTHVAQGLHSLGNLSQALQSEGMQVHRRLNADRDRLDALDNAAIVTEEAEQDGSGPAAQAIRREGRNAVSAIANAVADPVMLTDGIAQAAGSMVGAAGLARGIGLASERVLTGLGTKGGNSLVASLARIGRDSNVVLALGASEAGGAYVDTVAESLRLRPGDRDAANAAGGRAALWAGAGGMLAGKLVEGFAGHPTRVASVRGALQNAGNEAVEEGLQGISGTMAQNEALAQTGVDPNRPLSQGVGQQAGLGALYGFGSAGALQGPGAAAAIARAAGRHVVSAVTKNEAERTASTSAQSPVSDTRIATAIQALPKAGPGIQSAIQESNAPPEIKAESEQRIQNLLGVNDFDPSTAPASLAPVVEGAANKFEAISNLADYITAAPEGSNLISAATQLQSMVESYLTVLDRHEGDVATLRALPEDHPAQRVLGNIENLFGRISQTPKISKALADARAVIARGIEEGEIERAKNVDLNTSEGQETVANSVAMTAAQPLKGDIATNNAILLHNTQGKIKLTEDQHASLVNSTNLLRAAATALAEQKRLGHREISDLVSTNVVSERQEFSKELNKPAVEHTQGVIDAVRLGDMERASYLLTNFGEFVQHMSNKVDALNEAFSLGGGSKENQVYPLVRVAPGEFKRTGMRYGITPQSVKSLVTAQRIYLEAQTLASVYNGLVKALPNLKVKPFESTELNPELLGDVNELAREFKNGDRQIPNRPIIKQVKSDVARAPETTPAQSETPPAPNSNQTPVAKQNLAPVGEVRPKGEVVVETERSIVRDGDPSGANAKQDVSNSTGISAAFPELAGNAPGSKIENIFTKAFRLAKSEKSRVTVADEPISMVSSALASAEANAAFTGSTKAEAYTSEVFKAYQGYLASGMKLAEHINAGLNSFLAKSPKNEFYPKGHAKAGQRNPNFGRTNAERFRDGDGAQRWANGKMLNLLEKNPSGKGQVINPSLLQSAILAGLSWLQNVNQYTPNMDEQVVSALTGIPQDLVDDALIKRMSQGLLTVPTKRTLATKILQYWGFDTVNSVPEGWAQGIAEAMASEVLDAMIATDDLEKIVEIIQGEYGVTERVTINMYKARKFTEAEKVMDKWSSAIEETVLTEPEDKMYFGDELPPVAQSQMHNPAVRNTAQQKRMIANEQKTPHYVNLPIINLYAHLGDAGMNRLFGPGDFDRATKNDNHLKTLDGQAKTTRAGYEQLLKVVTEAQARADAAGVSVDQMPIRFGYNVSKVGRLQMLGRYNPQSTKIVREAILPTRSTLDLSQENSDHYEMFMLAIAQGLGVKVHKQSLGQSIAQTRALLDGKLASAVDMLRELQSQGDLDGDLVQTLKDGLGKDLTEVAVHVLNEYARFQNADASEHKAFTTSAYVEADGVTNGPINGMMLLSSGHFTADWVNRMAKGGLFLRQFTTMNEQAPANPDMYETTTEKLRGTFAALTQAVEGTPVAEQLVHVKKLLDLFISDFSYDRETETMTMKRGLSKNPLTITMYGSGNAGIAGNIVKEITSAIYEKMSDAMAAEKADPSLSDAEAMFGAGPESQAKYDAYVQAIGVLTTMIPVFEQRRWKLVEGVELKPSGKDKDLKTRTFHPGEIKNMVENIRLLFISPMSKAITQTLGADLITNTKLLRRATQVQSIFQADLFNRLVREKLEEKKANDPTYQVADFLSHDEQKEIQDIVLERFPIIETGTQSFYIANSASTDVNSTSFGSSLEHTWRTPGFVSGPADAGVAGIPTMVQGLGDANMMQLISSAPDHPTGHLMIFDGINFKLTTLKADSRKANRAVSKTWLEGNPLKNVSDAFSLSLPNMKVDELDDKTKIDLWRALTDEQAKTVAEVDVAELQSLIERTNRDTLYAAASVEARHRTVAKVQHHVDQMASAATPYENKGIVLTGTDDAQISDELNLLYLEERKAVAAEWKITPEKPAAVAGTKEAKHIESLGRKDAASGVQIVSTNALDKLARSTALSAGQSELLKQILRSDRTKEYTIVRGSMEQLQSYARNQGNRVLSDAQLSAAGNVHGYISVGDRTIYLTSTSTDETLIHELVHATTFHAIADHYAGNSTPEVADAVKRLEIMRDDFLAMRSTSQDQANAVSVIQAQTDPAMALNEFMAWTLANKTIGETLSKTAVNPFVKLANEIVSAIKKLVWGRREAPSLSDEVLSNILFNTSVIIRSQPSVSELVGENALFQSEIYGHSQRLSDVNKVFASKLSAYMQTVTTDFRADPATKRDPLTLANSVTKMAGELARRVIGLGFHMNGQEKTTFMMITSALATQATIDPNSMSRAQELYAHVVKSITPDSFRDPNAVDPESELNYAQQKYDAILGTGITGKDPDGRSSLLPVFLALAVVHDEFRSVLAKLPMPKGTKNQAGTLDALLVNFTNSRMDKLSGYLTNSTNSAHVQEAIDGLVRSITEEAQEREGLITTLSNVSGNLTTKGNDIVVNAIEKLSDKGVQSSSALVRSISGLLSEKHYNNVSEGALHLANQLRGFKTLRDLLGAIVGRTEQTGNVYDMIKLVRSTVSQLRQQFREDVPNIITKQFTRQLTTHEWDLLHSAMAKTDLAALHGHFSQADTLKFLHSETHIQNEMGKLETSLKKQDRQHFALVQSKAQALARFMNAGITTSNLLRNAESVAWLLNEPGVSSKRAAPTTSYIAEVDRLITLYALNMLSDQSKSDLFDLVQKEEKGLAFTYSYLLGQRNAELAKMTEMSRFNHYKGYAPIETQPGVSLIIADDKDFMKLAERSYVTLGGFNSSPADRDNLSRSYYFAPVSARAAFAQGIMQNVRPTVGGVDARTGVSDRMTGGIVTDPASVQRITKALSRENSKTGHMMPLFDQEGRVTAYERAVDPAMLQKISKPQHLAKLLGIWRGRQVEEALAEAVNMELVDELAAMHTKARESVGWRREYVNLADPAMQKADPVAFDAWKLFPQSIKEYSEEKFGIGNFWVRKDLLDDATGYRNATVGDAWTGNSRWSPRTQETMKRLAMLFGGNQAYAALVNNEQRVQNLVKDVKTLIVVKSVIVPMSNFISTMLQTMMRGVQLSTLVREMPKKIAEVNSYTKNRNREIEAEADLRVASANQDTVAMRRLTSEIRTLKDSYTRLSIWPLIKAGEYSAISDTTMSREDLQLSEGRLSEYVETLVSKLPASVQTAGRYALVSRDTALFSGLQKAAQYGDFLGKTILYDHLTQRRGKTSEQALAQITEEFANYDRLRGRTRGYLEDMGMIWFPTFKIQSMKTALSIIRNNPLNALLMSQVQLPDFFGSIGTPLSDNLASKAVDGTLGNAVGPGMAWRSLGLNPVVNLLD